MFEDNNDITNINNETVPDTCQPQPLTQQSTPQPDVQQAPDQYQYQYQPYNYQLDQNQVPPVTDQVPNAKKAKKAKKVKAAKTPKKRPFIVRAAAYLMCAIILGAVAGGACYGVNYAGYRVFPFEDNDKDDDNAATEVAKGELTTNKETETTKEQSEKVSANVLDVSDMVDSVITSCVAIQGKVKQTINYGFGSNTQEGTVSGSGIIIGSNDDELLIVTNAHVVDGADDLQAEFTDGTKLDAEVKGMKTSSDIAVISVKLKDIPKTAKYTVATLGDSANVKVGQAAIAIGNSMGYGISVTTGCISAVNRSVTVDQVTYGNLIQTDAAINPGNSGGALFNSNGEVIGINSVKMTDTTVEGMGYAISISSVKSIIEELSLKETRYKLDENKRGYLGIKGISITKDIADTYGYPVGVAIREVYDGSGAKAAGLVKNDIISEFDGNTISSMDELIDLMQYYGVGEKINIKYYHMSDGEYTEKNTIVTLGEAAKD